VASSGEDKGDLTIIEFEQEPRAQVTKETRINFTWTITKYPEKYLTEGIIYSLKIQDNHSGEIVHSKRFTIPTEPRTTFADIYSWPVPSNIDKGNYTSILRVPYDPPYARESRIDFAVVETLLVIQKSIDNKDKSLKGWKFKVTVDKKTRTYETNGQGEIMIPILEENAGKYYTIEEIPKDKWEPVPPNPKTVKVTKGKTITVPFINRPILTPPPTYLIIQKFNDSNQNDKVDSEDERLRYWKFIVTNPAGETRSYKTNTSGEIRIDLPREEVGDYKIVEIIKEPGWKLIKIDTDKTAPILDQGEQWIKIRVEEGKESKVRFLNYKPNTTILIQKFNDTNQNGKVDDGVDERLRGWEFKVTDPGGKTTTHFTNDIGEKRIKIPIGYEGKVYTIGEILKHNWTAITSTKQTKKVVEGKTTLFEFLNKPQTNLSIIKFYDHNQNGVQDPGDQGLAWNFTIKFPDGSIKRIRTDENGRYPLCNIPVGIYTITEEPRGCRWTSSTDMTKKVEVKGGQETIAQFRNYIAECCILPGCVWKNSDENIEVCKSVDPCSVALGKEEEVTVYLGICVDPKHIINGTKVENINVIDTLHSQFTIVDGSFSKEPKYDPIKNPDGTTTITWDISSLCCEEWRVSFNVTVAFALPIDVTDTSERITSKVIYEDPIEKDRRELSIPEGTLFIVPPPPIWCYVLGGLLVLSISIEITLELKRRKKEKSKGKEKE
jgi:hypothetical protein